MYIVKENLALVDIIKALRKFKATCGYNDKKLTVLNDIETEILKLAIVSEDEENKKDDERVL